MAEVGPMYRGKFNKVDAKPVPQRKHRIVNYNATEDIVECTCEFVGTAEAFDQHSNGRKRELYSNVLKDIKNSRGSYYLQGTSGFYIAAEDKIFD